MALSENYRAIHHWMNYNFPRSGRCEHCGAAGWTEYASVDHTYTRDRSDWRELCRSCHRAMDGANEHLSEAMKAYWARGGVVERMSEAMRASNHQLRKTHCPQGHPYDEQNTIRRRNQRECKACKHEARKRRRKAGLRG